MISECCHWAAIILATQRKTCMVTNIRVNTSDIMHVFSLWLKWLQEGTNFIWDSYVRVGSYNI